MRTVSILGATGSIGQSTLDVIEQARLHGDTIEMIALTAGRNAEELVAAARRVRPQVVAIADQSRADWVKEALAGTGIRVFSGDDGVHDAAQIPADWTMAAITGAAGLRPTLASVGHGTKVALANKECLVCAGDLLLSATRQFGTQLLPVDSEHNAIFQVLDRPERVSKLILTASGGPFRTKSLDFMRRATRDDALAHPTWNMGPKITIDCATMMNKGLELIEAALLFNMPEDRIEVVVHPQSIIHSLVAYVDGSVLAQMSSPDMRVPIAHAFAWPDRMALATKPFCLSSLGSLTFEAPDMARFPALELARLATRERRGTPLALNAANEIAVAAFLAGQIGFLDIPTIVAQTIETMTKSREIGVAEPESFDHVYALDTRARQLAETRVHAVLA